MQSERKEEENMRNNLIKILIADSNKSSAQQLSRFLKEREEIEQVMLVSDGTSAYNTILHAKPNIVLLDVVLAGMDGLGVLEKVKETMAAPEVPGFIFVTSISTETLIECTCKMGADYFILKPYNIENIYNRILQIAMRHQMRKESSSIIARPKMKNESFIQVKATEGMSLMDERMVQIEAEITEMIIEIGIPANIKGYQYIRDGIMMAIRDMKVLNYITKLLYPTIAQKYKTTSSSVERAIRHAIEIAWKRGRIDAMEEMLGYPMSVNQRKPTNSEFIALIADKMCLEYRIHA